MTLKTKPLNISEHLRTPNEVITFLYEVLKTGNKYDFIHALSIVTSKNKGIKKARTFDAGRSMSP